MLSEDGLENLWTHIYQMTASVTPLSFDCGQLCDSICCRDWAPGVGIYLFPGEQLLIGDQPWLQRKWHDSRRYLFPPSWDRGGWFVTCNEHCPRQLRPFACRTFPLTARMDRPGRLRMVLDRNGAAICPLVQSGRPEFLTARFRATMKRAWEILLCLEPIRDDVLLSSPGAMRES
ncbi:MAG: hypothetical protein R6U70_04245 [Bacillota bacterium]